MKILYAIQGTGNGHLSRANDIVPILKKNAETDVLVSGIQSDVNVGFDIDFRLSGLSFIFGKKGGVDILKTIRKAQIGKLIRDIRKFPVHNYDLVINDFEPVSAWAAKLRKVPCISLSHQAAVIHPNAPKPPKTDWTGKSVLKYYAPTCEKYGFHFKQYASNIFTPVVRQEISSKVPFNMGHYTVYLPAYSDEKIIRILQHFPDIKWQVFSKHTSSNYSAGSIEIRKISNGEFINSMLGAEGILCGAGFETPAEALFLGKKLMVVPMLNQYEQQCNAAALAEMGVPVIKSLSKEALLPILNWIDQPKALKVSYNNETESIISRILTEWKTRIFSANDAEINPLSHILTYHNLNNTAV